MKVIRNDIIPFGRMFGAVNLFGILFAKRHMPLTPQVINHEEIHTAQIRELLYLPFYVVYLAEWLYRLVKHRGNIADAYFDISFEREAYAFGDDLSYLSRRRHFAQWRTPSL